MDSFPCSFNKFCSDSVYSFLLISQLPVTVQQFSNLPDNLCPCHIRSGTETGLNITQAFLNIVECYCRMGWRWWVGGFVHGWWWDGFVMVGWVCDGVMGP